MSCPAFLRGEDVLVDVSHFRYIEDKAHRTTAPTECEINDMLAAYPTTESLLKDVILRLQSENHRISGDMLIFLMRIHETKTKIHKYKTIRKIMLSPEVGRELRRLNEIEPSVEGQTITVGPKLPVMNLIGYYEIRPLFDIVYANTSHKEPWVRSSAYVSIGDISKIEKRKALQYLRRGLNDNGTFMVGPSFPSSVRESAAYTCMDLGFRFRLLLWIHAPEYRYKLFE